MAFLDSADMLARAQALANRPATDESMSAAAWYLLLSEAQAHWTGTIAAQAPWVMMGAPTLLTSSDSGATYVFLDASSNAIMPLAVEIYDSSGGRLLKPGPYWDASCDYVWEGTKIRFPKGATKTFSGGPYARYVSPPGLLNASYAPTLLPTHARLLAVYRAVSYWASRGGMRDPLPYIAMEQRLWFGDPRSGDVGILGALKMTNPLLGAAAYGSSTGGILDGVDTGSGYQMLRI